MRKEQHTLAGHRGPINAVALQDDHAVTGSGDGEVRLWNVNAFAGYCVRVFEGHDHGVACVDFKDGLVFSGSSDCTIKIWSASTGACLSTLSNHTLFVRSLQYDRFEKRLVSAGYDRTIKVWDVEDPEKVNLSREFAVHESPIFEVKFDERRIVMCV